MDSRIFDIAVLIASQHDELNGSLPSASSSYIDGNEVILVGLDGAIISQVSLTQVFDYQASNLTVGGEIQSVNRENDSNDDNRNPNPSTINTDHQIEPTSDSRISAAYPEFAQYLSGTDVDALLLRLDDKLKEYSLTESSPLTSSLILESLEKNSPNSDAVTTAHRRKVGIETQDLSVTHVYIIGKCAQVNLCVFNDFKEVSLDREAYEMAMDNYELECENYQADMRAYEIAKQQFELRRDLKRENSRRRRDAELLRQQMNPGSTPDLFVGFGDMIEGIGDMFRAPKRPKQPDIPDQKSYYRPLIPRRRELKETPIYYSKFASFTRFAGDKLRDIPPRAANLLDQSIQQLFSGIMPDKFFDLSETLMRDSQIVVSNENVDPIDEIMKIFILRSMQRESNSFNRDLASGSDESIGDSLVGFVLKSMNIRDVGIGLAICTSTTDISLGKKFFTTVHLTLKPELCLMDFEGLIT